MSTTVIDLNRIEWHYRPTSTTGKEFGQKKMIEDPDTKMSVVMNRYPKGFTTITHRHPCGHGLYILEGQLKTNKGIYGPNTLVWFPEGCIAEHGATEHEDVTVLLISNKEFGIQYMKNEEEIKAFDQGIEPKVMDCGRIPWYQREASTSKRIFGKKMLHADEETGMEINCMYYPKGFTTERHKHPCAQGLYVLQGQLRIDKEYYGPGTMAWFDEGDVVEHGASAVEDLICLELSNKRIEMDYQ